MAYPSMEGTNCSCADMLALNTKRPVAAVASTAYITGLLVDRPGNCASASGVSLMTCRVRCCIVDIVTCVQHEWLSPRKSWWHIHTGPGTYQRSQTKADETGEHGVAW